MSCHLPVPRGLRELEVSTEERTERDLRMDLDDPVIARGDLRHPLDVVAESPRLMGDLLPAEEPSCDCIGLRVRLCCKDFGRRRDEDALPAGPTNSRASTSAWRSLAGSPIGMSIAMLTASAGWPISDSRSWLT